MKTSDAQKSWAVLQKDMRIQVREWFESFLFWPSREDVVFIAKQTPADKMYAPGTADTIIEIYKNGVLIFTDDAPWPGGIGEQMLLLQVYLMSQRPNYKKPKKWQKAMEQFCWSYPEFEPPSKLTWSKNPYK